MARLATTLGFVVTGCGAGVNGYRAGLAEGDRAYSAGRYREAAQAYERAALSTGAARDQDDARYRAAMACRRVGDRECAQRLLAPVAARGSAWDHGPRARLELASLGLESASPEQVVAAHRALATLIEDAPDTGPARGALRLRLRALDARDPAGAASVAWLESLARDPRIRRSILFESVLAERATRVAAAGDGAAAEAAWAEVIASVPYPQNSHWDDGHLALARLQRAGGRPREALATLSRMLSVREASWGNGSYAAPRFDDGAWLQAEILRDDLRDVSQAADAYHRVYAEHVTSLRRDDALWEEAALRRRSDPQAACRVWRTLAQEFPCRRFGARARAELVACDGGAPAGVGCARGG
ncbi:MAG: hypothetical protein Q8S73_39000 [Deltaproteobacteria bacterium]|nr:hypothetical protein [Myxococcales bacterium]MDP3220155.1 hypothetical protein [Deltaproteobacteria bacterium]